MTSLRMVMPASSTSSRPASNRNAVDLPEPDGPTSARNSPSAISSFSWSTALTGGSPWCMRDALTYATLSHL